MLGRFGANNHHPSLAADNLTVATHRFDRRPYFHRSAIRGLYEGL